MKNEVGQKDGNGCGISLGLHVAINVYLPFD
jgi:hypothetical protein